MTYHFLAICICRIQRDTPIDSPRPNDADQLRKMPNNESHLQPWKSKTSQGTGDFRSNPTLNLSESL